MIFFRWIEIGIIRGLSEELANEELECRSLEAECETDEEEK